MELPVHHTVQAQQQLCLLLYIKNSIVIYLINNWLRKTGVIPPLPNLSLWGTAYEDGEHIYCLLNDTVGNSDYGSTE
jgi:hypothetical protein